MTVSEEKIPLCVPELDENEIASATEAIKSGWLAHGSYNEKLEEEFADYIGVEHAITVNSCTSALQLALEAHEITGEVLVPSCTFVASVNAILTAGARPVFVEVNGSTMSLDVGDAEEKVGPETEAIMPVHFAGQSCPMNSVCEFAEEHDLLVVEDSAEAIGSEWNGQKTGSFGKVGCFSFFPTKNMTTGEGGMLTTDDEDLATKLRALIGHGITSTTYDREEKDVSWFRSATWPGYNYRMSNVLAAIGYEQFQKLPSMNEKRRKIASKYDESFKEIPAIVTPSVDPKSKHVYQMYVVLLKDPLNRDEFVQILNDRGVGASVHFYPPVHQQHYYRDHYRVNLPRTERLSEQCVTLPIYPGMSREDAKRVIEVTRETAGELNPSGRVG